MAVIKIVPMPGAVGDKGDEGAPGSQGPQGPAGQNGLPGTPALWSYQGAYNSAAAYAVGDVIVYQGQLYYTKSVTTAGTLPTNTTKFDLIAAKGADGTNGTDGATPFTLVGAYDNGAAYNLGIAVYYNGGTYVRTGNPLNPGYPPTLGAINESWTPIAEKGADSIAPTSGTWDIKVLETSGIIGETGSYSENTKLGRYYTIGDLVFIEVNFIVNQPTDWGNYGAFSGELPFPIADGWQTGTLGGRHYLQGRYFGRADAEPIGSWEADELGNVDMVATLFVSAIDGKSMFALYTTDKESVNTNSESLRPINPDWPINLRVENSTISPYMTFRFSGVYRKA
jgi:hypothetical protein